MCAPGRCRRTQRVRERRQPGRCVATALQQPADSLIPDGPARPAHTTTPVARAP